MIHTVAKTFRASQYPNSPEAIGVKWDVIKDQQEYQFKIAGRPRVFHVSVRDAVFWAGKYPPPNASGFLHVKGRNHILIIPNNLWTTKEEKQEVLF